MVLEGGKPVGTVQWALLGAHNAENALAAIGAARHAGVPVSQSIAALAEFKGVKRRMELRGEVRGIAVYDDFAHHPTAIASTIDGLRRKVGDKRIVAVLEPRSATMRMGVHRDTLAPSLGGRGRGVDVRAAGSRLGCGRRGGVARLARAASRVRSTSWSTGLAGSAARRRPGAHHEQRRLRRAARQTTRGAGAGGPETC